MHGAFRTENRLHLGMFHWLEMHNAQESPTSKQITDWCAFVNEFSSFVFIMKFSSSSRASSLMLVNIIMPEIKQCTHKKSDSVSHFWLKTNEKMNKFWVVSSSLNFFDAPNYDSNHICLFNILIKISRCRTLTAATNIIYCYKTLNMKPKR